MLEVSLRRLQYEPRGSSFSLGPLDLDFARSEATCLLGDAGSGKTTLLRLLAGELQPRSGSVLAGERDLTSLAGARRPFLYARRDLRVSRWWSAGHLLIAAVQHRGLESEERRRTVVSAAERWGVAALLGRRVSSLSSGERARLRFAQIEILRPAVVLLERIFEASPPAETAAFLGVMKDAGTTVIAEVSRLDEISSYEHAVVLSHGAAVESGRVAELYRAPATAEGARASGIVSEVPVEVRDGTVESPIGFWPAGQAGFSGPGVALVRPNAFTAARRGEESDFILAVDRATLTDAGWLVRGHVSGAIRLTVVLPADAQPRVRAPLPLRFDPSGALMLPNPGGSPLRTAGTPLPPRSETR
jgi:iron(III) transport system ATP-binding protein